MKLKLFIPIMLVAFLAGSAVAYGQDNNEKKINRIMRKIEKQNKKLQELNGEEYHAHKHINPVVDSEEMENYRDAMRENRQQLRQQAEELKEQFREMREKELEVFRDHNGKSSFYYYETPKFDLKVLDSLTAGIPDLKIDFPKLKGDVYALLSDQDMLTIEKELAGETISADFNYEVKEGATGLSLSINGSIDSGKVMITIKKPDGSVFNEYTLSPLANVNYHQTLNFNEEEESAYIGKWTITVAAENAKGKYNIQIR